MSPLKIRSADSMDHHLKIMLYGHPGSGKTALGATLQFHPKTTGVLILNVEGGMFSLKDIDWGEYGAPLVADVPDVKSLEEVFWMLRDGAEEFKDIKTVVLDSLTEIMQKDLEATVESKLNQKSRSGKQRQNVDDAWLEDRGEVTTRQARLVRGFRDLPLHFVATAHPRITWRKNEADMPATDLPPLKFEPAFGDRLRTHLCGYCDYVWVMKEGDGSHHNVLTQSTGPYYAKSRARSFEQLGSVIKWPVGTPLLADVYSTVVEGEEFPAHYSAKAQENA